MPLKFKGNKEFLKWSKRVTKIKAKAAKKGTSK